MKRRKIDYKVLGNLVGALVTGAYILKVLYMLLIYPVITKKVISLTTTGLLFTILAVMIFILCTDTVVSKIKRINKED